MLVFFVLGTGVKMAPVALGVNSGSVWYRYTDGLGYLAGDMALHRSSSYLYSHLKPIDHPKDDVPHPKTGANLRALGLLLHVA